MDIRTMQYYLTVVREGTISAAAKALHVSQPSLSRQMRDLEEELGAALFVRGNRKITLTEEGMILRKRAEEMVHLMKMAEEFEKNGAGKNDIKSNRRIFLVFVLLKMPAFWCGSGIFFARNPAFVTH